MKVLVLNCGSSSVKYKLFDLQENKVVAWGLAERIGTPGSKLRHLAGDRKEFILEKPLPGHQEAVEIILQLLVHADHGVLSNLGEIKAVGHRVVHGGSLFREPVAVDDNVLELLEECSKLAPLHNPPNINGIQACRKLIPQAVQVSVLDTAFHQTIPDYAHMYAIPYEICQVHQVRKYGFHGISHQYVADMSARMLGVKLESLKIITCHLGNGASICAISEGKSMDTTMGFTPLAGLIMGTRCGDIDPAIIPFLMEKEKMTPADVGEMLNKRSGVLGVSGISSDFRDLEQGAGMGNPRARLAVEMFTYSVTKAIGSLLPAIDGLDVLVFTAGIGENSPKIRRKVCSGLRWLGISLDEQKNLIKGEAVEISTPDSAVRVLVVPTDEERMIAEKAMAVAREVLFVKHVS